MSVLLAPFLILHRIVGPFFYEQNSFLVFLLVTIILGGGTAYLTGRAIAGTWRPAWQVVLAVLVLGFAVRFFHFALFGGTLLSPYYYAVDTLLCMAFGFWGYRMTRSGQMAEQYRWLYRRAGPLTWVRKKAAPNDAGPQSG